MLPLIINPMPIPSQVINLVSNLPPITTSLQFGSAIRTNSWVRSSFTTGSNSFILTSVTLQFRQNTANTNLFVRIYENNAGVLGNLITSFINPASISTTVPHGAATVFTLTTPQTLAVNTSYWLVVGVDAPVGTPGEYSWRGTNSFDQTGEAGWSVGDSSLFTSDQGLSWFISTIANAFQFSINGQNY